MSSRTGPSPEPLPGGEAPSTAGLLAVACGPPGPAAVAALARLDVAARDELVGRLDATDRLAVLQACERAARWLHALTGRAMLAACGPFPVDPLATTSPGVEAPGGAAAELVDPATVGGVLGLSARSAVRHIALAGALHTRLPATAAALSAGDISARHADAVAEAAWVLPDPLLPALEAVTVPKAATQPLGRFRRTVAAAVLAADPAAAAREADEARDERGLRARLDTAAVEGLAHLDADLPLADAVTVLDALDTVSCWLATTASPATAEDAVSAAAIGAGAGAGGRLPSVATRRVDALVAMSRAVLDDCSGCALRPPGDSSSPTGSDARSNVGPATSTDTRTSAPVVSRFAVNVTLDLQTALGLRNWPGEVDGGAPIPASLARALAFDERAVWRRWITDPTDGRLLDRGSRTYRPSEALREFVMARDRTCRYPGCARAGQHTDLDHRVPFDDGGDTTRDNLHLLCRRHHRLKSAGLAEPLPDPASGPDPDDGPGPGFGSVPGFDAGAGTTWRLRLPDGGSRTVVRAREPSVSAVAAEITGSVEVPAPP